MDAVRKRTNAKISFRGCGSVYYVIPDLIDLGIDILDPIQVAAHEYGTGTIEARIWETSLLLGEH